MVDFNNEATIGTPAADVEKISILQRRYDLIEAYEDYKKKRFSGAALSLNVFRARLLSLFIELQATLKRRLKDNEEYRKIKDTCLNSKDEDELRDVFFKINDFLDELRLTRIDTQRVYDSQDVEAESKIKGF